MKTDLPAVLPQAVTVRFPRYDTDSGSPVFSGVYYHIPVTLASLALPEFNGVKPNSGTELLHVGQAATYLAGVLQNGTALNAYAAQAATDWYRYQASPVDVSLAGVCPWAPEGLSDRVEFRYAKDRVTMDVRRPPFMDRAADLAPLITPTIVSGGGTGVSLQAVRVYTPAGVTTWALAGGTTVTPTASGGVFNGTTVDTPSDGVALPTGTINVVSTMGFPTAGLLHVGVSGGGRLNVVTYTGTTSTSFTGCTGGTGTMHTGGAVYTLTQFTWTKPVGLKYARVWVVGAGGVGGGAFIPRIEQGGVPGMAVAGGGGSGGGAAFKTFQAAALGSAMTVQVGMGGRDGDFGDGENFNIIGRVSQFNYSPPTTGAITNATNATPIQITSVAHGLQTNDSVTVSGVGGNTAANRVYGWIVVVIDADNFTLYDTPPGLFDGSGTPSSGNAPYTSGGTWTRLVALSARGGQDGANGGVSVLGTLINFANAGGIDNDGITPFPGTIIQYPGQGGSLEDGFTGGLGDINWLGEQGSPGMVAPDYQVGPAGASGVTGGGYGVTPASSVRNYGPGSPSATGPGVPGGVPGSLGFTLVELLGGYTYTVAPQFNAVPGKGGRAGGPFSGGGMASSYAAEVSNPLSPGSGSSGAVVVWRYGLPTQFYPNGLRDNAGRSNDGMVVIEEYY